MCVCIIFNSLLDCTYQLLKSMALIVWSLSHMHFNIHLSTLSAQIFHFLYYNYCCCLLLLLFGFYYALSFVAANQTILIPLTQCSQAACHSATMIKPNKYFAKTFTVVQHDSLLQLLYNTIAFHSASLLAHRYLYHMLVHMKDTYVRACVWVCGCVILCISFNLCLKSSPSTQTGQCELQKFPTSLFGFKLERDLQKKGNLFALKTITTERLFNSKWPKQI